MIDASTRLCCLIGHPVSHSLSPQIHNAAFKALNLNYAYLTFDVRVDELENAIRGLKALGAAGFNITIPHKIRAVRFLDELDEVAEKAGAVNTVVIKNEKLFGYNTDVYGVEESLRNLDLPKSKPALVIGAGGAAKAVLVALLNLGFRRFVIANRTIRKAEALASWIESMNAEAEFCGLDQIKEKSAGCGLLVNATPIGMTPKTDETPLTSGEIPRTSTALDLVYNPLKTRFLKEAEKAGAETISGLSVLVHQAAKAFELWTDCCPPLGVMWDAAAQALRGIYG